MKTVYVSQRPSNVRTAEGIEPRFKIEGPASELVGKVSFVYLTEFTDVKYKTARELMDQMRKKLVTFDDGDYVLMVGHVLTQVLAGLAAAEMNEGNVNILHWDAQAREYHSNEIDLYLKGADYDHA